MFDTWITHLSKLSLWHARNPLQLSEHLSDECETYVDQTKKDDGEETTELAKHHQKCKLKTHQQQTETRSLLSSECQWSKQQIKIELKHIDCKKAERPFVNQHIH